MESGECIWVDFHESIPMSKDGHTSEQISISLHQIREQNSTEINHLIFLAHKYVV